MTTLGAGGPPGTLHAPICVDGFDGYDAADQSQSAKPVAYPTFYSADFKTPESLKQFNNELYEFYQRMEGRLPYD